MYKFTVEIDNKFLSIEPLNEDAEFWLKEAIVEDKISLKESLDLIGWQNASDYKITELANII